MVGRPSAFDSLRLKAVVVDRGLQAPLVTFVADSSFAPLIPLIWSALMNERSTTPEPFEQSFHAGSVLVCTCPPSRVGLLVFRQQMLLVVRSTPLLPGIGPLFETARGRFWCREALAAETPRLQTPR